MRVPAGPLGMNMDTMVDWQRVEALFYAAWELPAAQREQWIMAQDDSPAVRAHALALLEAEIGRASCRERV